MKRSRRASPQTASVVIALAAEPQAWRYGYDLCQETGLKAGTMYPILMRLADQRLLETSWEQPLVPGRPPRHLYRLTAPGLALAQGIARAAGPAPAAKPSRPHLGLEGAT
jgi:PadR family transcriptional regulator, regulatory protein PadR